MLLWPAGCSVRQPRPPTCLPADSTSSTYSGRTAAAAVYAEDADDQMQGGAGWLAGGSRRRSGRRRHEGQRRDSHGLCPLGVDECDLVAQLVRVLDVEQAHCNVASQGR